MTREVFLLQLQTFAASASPDELEVLAVIATRMTSGQAVYGRLSLDSDPRDMLDEAFAESTDMTVYLAMQKVRMERERLRASEQEASDAG